MLFWQVKLAMTTQCSVANKTNENCQDRIKKKNSVTFISFLYTTIGGSYFLQFSEQGLSLNKGVRIFKIRFSFHFIVLIFFVLFDERSKLCLDWR